MSDGTRDALAGRRWLVLQLHPYAAKTRRTLEIATELRKQLGMKDVDVRYAVREDETRKYSSAYDEYFFVEFLPDCVYKQLRDEEFFFGFLLDGAGEYTTVTDGDVERMLGEARRRSPLSVGDWVQVLQGEYRGYTGSVFFYDADADHPQVIVRVVLGDGVQELILPRDWVKKRRKERS
jgi:hypothetical protein